MQEDACGPHQEEDNTLSLYFFLIERLDLPASLSSCFLTPGFKLIGSTVNRKQLFMYQSSSAQVTARLNLLCDGQKHDFFRIQCREALASLPKVGVLKNNSYYMLRGWQEMNSKCMYDRAAQYADNFSSLLPYLAVQYGSDPLAIVLKIDSELV